MNSLAKSSLLVFAIVIVSFVSYGQETKKEGPKFDNVDFSRKLEIVQWLVEYDNVAWKTTDILLTQDKAEMSKLGAEWFCFQQGHVTLDHVETDYNTGTLFMRVNNGSIYGILPRTNAAGDPVNFLSVNDIKASSATIITTQELGTFTRPIVMDINNSLTYIAVGGFRPVVYGNPSIVDSSDLQGNAIGSVGAISGQQLIELESLADVDPAIFTAVRTYNYDDISIRMPSDQLFEDEAEDEEEDENNKKNR